MLAGALAVLAAALLFFRDGKGKQPAAPEAGKSSETQSSAAGNSAFDRLQAKAAARAEKAEAERLANWKANFPYKQTTDPAVVFDPNHPRAVEIRNNHGFLTSFFRSEARFTPQFEQLYHILKEYDRHDNPIEVGRIFRDLSNYHQFMNDDPEKVLSHIAGVRTNKQTGQLYFYYEPSISMETGKPRTYAGEAKACRDSVCTSLYQPKHWPDKEKMYTQKEVAAIFDRLASEIQGLDALPDSNMGIDGDASKALRPGDSPLVPYAGWQVSYNKWMAKAERGLSRRIREGDPYLKKHWPELFEQSPPQTPSKRKGNLIGPKGELLAADGKPVIAGDDFFGGMITEEGEIIPLEMEEDGTVYVPLEALDKALSGGD